MLYYIYVYWDDINLAIAWPLQEDPCSIVSDWYYFGGLGRCDPFGQVSHHVSALVKTLRTRPFDFRHFAEGNVGSQIWASLIPLGTSIS